MTSLEYETNRKKKARKFSQYLEPHHDVMCAQGKPIELLKLN